MSQATPSPPEPNAFAAGSSRSEVTLPPPITDPPPYPAPPQPDEDLFAATRAWLQDIVEEMERIDADLPTDLAENHRNYRRLRRGNE